MCPLTATGGNLTTSEETITLTRREYDALIELNSRLGDTLAAQDANDGVRVPHNVALDIMRGKNPVLAFRKYRGFTLRKLFERTGVAAGYISEIERGLKPGPSSALARIAGALGTTIDVLVSE